MGPLDKPPASLALLPSRASSRTHSSSNPAVLAPQCRYEAIREWSYTTFSVNEAGNVRQPCCIQVRFYCTQNIISDWMRSCRVSDPDQYPDPHGPALIWVAGSGSRRAKMTHKNRKKSRIFMFLSTGCSLLRAEGFSCSLGVLYGGLGISKLQFFFKKIEIKFPAINFFQF